MALRVLLGDESSTIRKVFQLSLQDFAIEVKSVHLGIDVPDVAKSFKPDIIFADILLLKKDGYEVCAEIKNDSELGHTPVILMWSQFMSLDEDKYLSSQADGRLEKPFEAPELRKLIEQFVPKTRTQKVSQYLTFPKLPEFDTQSQQPQEPDEPVMVQVPTTENEPEEDFSAKPIQLDDSTLPPLPVEPEALVENSPVDKTNEDSEIFFGDESEGDQQWVNKGLDDFKLEIDKNISDEALPEVPLLDPIQDENVAIELEPLAELAPEPEPSPGMSTGENIEIELELDNNSPARDVEIPNTPSPDSILEGTISEETRKIIESVVWKVVPDLAERIIEKEIKRLLSEQENTLK